MDFAPIQQDSVERLWCKLRAHVRSKARLTDQVALTQHQRRVSFVHRALDGVVALNTVQYVVYYPMAAVQLYLKAEREWPAIWKSTWFKRSKNERNLFWTKFIDDLVAGRWNPPLQWSMSNADIKDRRWWKLLTSNFWHANLGHYCSNMVALWGAGSVCATLPTMTATHTVAITLGSALASSSFMVWQLNVYRPQYMWATCGASGIVSAFIAIAGLGAPFEKLRLQLGPFEATGSAWLFALIGVGGDLVMWMEQHNKKWWELLLEPSKVGHGAHLAGAAFGAIYYAVFLRPQRVERNFEVAKNGGEGTDTQQAGCVG